MIFHTVIFVIGKEVLKMLVKSIMLKNTVVLYEDEYVTKAIKKLKKLNLFYFPVIDRLGFPAGILSRQYLDLKIEDYEGLRVKDIIKPIGDHEIVREFEEINMIFNKPGEMFLAVDDHGKFKGLLEKRHLMKKYFEKYEYTNANLKGVLEFIDSAVLSINRQGKIVFINNNAKELLGIEDDELKGVEINELLQDMNLTVDLYNSEREFSRSYDLNGKNVVFSRFIMEKNNRVIGAICSLKDITEYDEIGNGLAVEETEMEVLKSVFETAYDGLIVVDAKGYITMISDAYKRFLGVDNENIVGKHVTEIIENTRLHKVAETGVPEIADLQKIKDDYIVVSRIPVFKNGKVTSVVGKIMFRNIGELEKLYKKIGKIEQQLENYKDELSKINKAKYNFGDIVGKSSEMKQVINLAKKAVYTNSNVLILGGSGTGKELFAHSIHNSSAR